MSDKPTSAAATAREVALAIDDTDHGNVTSSRESLTLSTMSASSRPSLSNNQQPNNKSSSVHTRTSSSTVATMTTMSSHHDSFQADQVVIMEPALEEGMEMLTTAATEPSKEPTKSILSTSLTTPATGGGAADGTPVMASPGIPKSRLQRGRSDPVPSTSTFAAKSSHGQLTTPETKGRILPRSGFSQPVMTATQRRNDGFSNATPNNVILAKPTLKLCKLCARKPLRWYDQAALQALQEMGGGGGDHDGIDGFMELIYSIQNQELHDKNKKNNKKGGPSVELEQAEGIVTRASRKVKEFLQQCEQNFAQYAPDDIHLYKTNLESMGLFEWEEMKLGRLLGVGGFSNVMEITGFAPDSSRDAPVPPTDKGGEQETSNQEEEDDQQPQLPPSEEHTSGNFKLYNTKEVVARKFLARHAKRAPRRDSASSSHSHIAAATNSNSSLTKKNNRKGGNDKKKKPEPPTYRYALKHLRPGLAERTDKRTFNCAAVDLILEAQILMSLQHPNIIKLRGFASAGPEGYVEGGGHHNGYFIILDQLPETMAQRIHRWRKQVKQSKSTTKKISMAAANVFSFRRRRKNAEPNLDWQHHANEALNSLLQERLFVAYEICGAMEYLHSRRMINRDLKVANIGFDVRSDVKLFDFGLSRFLPTSLIYNSDDGGSSSRAASGGVTKALLDETFHMSAVGTKLYMAPEVQSRQPYSTKADVYSFGVVLWEMLALADPYWRKPAKDYHVAIDAARKALQQLPFCPCWPLPLQQMLQKCLSIDPKQRPSFTDIRRIFRDHLNVKVEEEIHDHLETSESCHTYMMPAFGHNRVMQSSGHTSRQVAKSSSFQYDSVEEEEEAIALDPKDDDIDTDERGDRIASMRDCDCPPPGGRRRRSTFVLNFKDLSWLSSSNSSRSFRQNTTSNRSPSFRGSFQGGIKE